MIRTAVLLLGSVGAMAFPSTAHAQAGPAQGPTAEAKPTKGQHGANGPAASEPGAAIVVTGSRVTTGKNSPTPLTVLSADQLQTIRPGPISESLDVLPAFAGSRARTNNPLVTGTAGQGNGNANQLALRNLGPNRTLILLDGRRLPPTSTNNIVDIDIIPQELLKRVDVVTGGVSAVYGSDAITGVVNFVTDTDFTGVKSHVQTGISKYADDASVEAGIAYGTHLFGGRGHFMASYEYHKDDGVDRRSDRPSLGRAIIVGDGSAASPFKLVTGATVSSLPFGGRITCAASCPLNGEYFASDGVLAPFDAGQPILDNGKPDSTAQIGGAGGYYDSSLKGSLKSHQAYARFDYDLTDTTTFFVSGAYTFKNNVSYRDSLLLSRVSLSSTNAFLTPQQSALLSASGQTFSFSELNTQGGRFGGDIDTKNMLIVTGLKGDTGAFQWDIGYTHGYSELHTILQNDVNQQHLAAALDAVRVGNSIVCGINADAITTNDDPRCAPLNVFGPTASSQAALNYVLEDPKYIAHTFLDDASADVRATPFSTWAGPVKMAVSGEWRKERFDATTTASSNDFANCAGISLNCTPSTTVFRETFAPSAPVHQSVWEVAAEADVPLLQNVTLAKSLSVNGAVRYTNYDTSGHYWTWKAGVSWELNSDLRLRGTISRDIRAPTLSDLFSPPTSGVTSQPDLLTNVPGSRVKITSGNPNLTAEIGNTITAGFVWTPRFAPGFSLTADYYNIRIKNAITEISGFGAAYQQACYQSGGTSPFCALQVRPINYTDTSPANEVERWYIEQVNIGKISTHGVDVEANYHLPVSGHPLGVRLLGNWQPTILYTQAGAPNLDLGGVAFGQSYYTASPKLQITGEVSYQPTSFLELDLQYRWRDRIKLTSNPGVWEGPDSVKPFGVAALNISFKVPDPRLQDLRLFFNIQNLFNAIPPAAASTGTSATPGLADGFVSTDDPIGRYFTVGARMRF